MPRHNRLTPCVPALYETVPTHRTRGPCTAGVALSYTTRPGRPGRRDAIGVPSRSREARMNRLDALARRGARAGRAVLDISRDAVARFDRRARSTPVVE